MNRTVAIVIAYISEVALFMGLFLSMFFKFAVGIRILNHPFYRSSDPEPLIAIISGIIYLGIILLYLKGLKIRSISSRVGYIPVTGIPVAIAIFSLFYLMSFDQILGNISNLFDPHLTLTQKTFFQKAIIHTGLSVIFGFLLSRLAFKLLSLPEFKPNMFLSSLCIGFYGCILLVSPLLYRSEGWLIRWIPKAIWALALLALSVNMFRWKRLNRKLVNLSALLWALNSLSNIILSWLRPDIEITIIRIFSFVIGVVYLFITLLVSILLIYGLEWRGSTIKLAVSAILLYAFGSLVSYLNTVKYFLESQSSILLEVLYGNNYRYWRGYAVWFQLDFRLLSLALTLSLFGMALAIYRYEQIRSG